MWDGTPADSSRPRPKRLEVVWPGSVRFRLDTPRLLVVLEKDLKTKGLTE